MWLVGWEIGHPLLESDQGVDDALRQLGLIGDLPELEVGEESLHQVLEPLRVIPSHLQERAVAGEVGCHRLDQLHQRHSGLNQRPLQSTVHVLEDVCLPIRDHVPGHEDAHVDHEGRICVSVALDREVVDAHEAVLDNLDPRLFPQLDDKHFEPKEGGVLEFNNQNIK